ncbi:Gfo/Idh/MocA family oxidoreductase [Haloechinothrix sp. LS1_15]|uniref:Gfo/Idh/MocA family oxidoreductase n=1 Tax=Haloechinothrix sp. LS1_15 TaxID=2652248 RepID=UPI0029472E72|nr:Gfo/Idh/MocA family oxidoreductase [Haloechinothrix sp. LS1_15]MDV6012580.1 oxidoreductase [Haloechinothrix sp. LS1_15]
MKIGIAGVGRIGLMHAENLGALDAVADILLFDPQPERAAHVAAGLGAKARAVADLDELMSACDGVLLATPTGTHPEMVRRAITAGTPVLCEKPLAATLAEMEPLVTEIEASGVPVVVGFHRRFDPATVAAYRRLRSGQAGSVYLVRAVCNDADPPPVEFVASSGGLFKDCLIHELDAVPWLVGQSVVEVYASGSVLVDSSFAEVGDWDNVVATLRFDSGAHAVLSAGRHDPLGYDCRTEVFTSVDTFAIGWDDRTPLNSLEERGSSVSPDAYRGFQERYRPAYLNEMRVFAGIVAGEAENPSPARDSLLSLRLAEACEESVRTGQPVRMDG